MVRQMVMTETSFFPRVLRYTDIASYLFTAIFIALDAGVPWVFHQFHLAGATFLPMHYFVLLGGLLFGWRAGLIIGLFTPLVSYGLSGMPALPVLPQIVVELSFYGITAGILREKLHLRIFWALSGAMLAGRLALLLTVSILSIFVTVHSPVGFAANPLAAVWTTVEQGWPGIVIQLSCISLITVLLERISGRTKIEIKK